MNTTGLAMTVTDELLAELEHRHMSDPKGAIPVFCSDIAALTAELRRLRAENAGLAKDDARLKFVIDEEITISKMNGTGSPMVYQCQWNDCRQVDWYSSPAEAIDTAMFDAAMAAQ